MPNWMHNILVIQAVVDSTEESKNILDVNDFMMKTIHRRPDNDKKDVLDLSLEHSTPRSYSSPE